MVIIVTDEGRFWNHKNPLLERYADCVIVVCLNGKKVTDKYRCFVSPYGEMTGLGMTDNSISSEKYQALYSVKHNLRNLYGYHDDIVFLTDNEPQSLFPYLVLKDYEEFNNLHLWCMTPWSFEGNRKIEIYKELLNDFSNLKSLLYFDGDMMLSHAQKGISLKDFLDLVDSYCADLLPTVICDIGTNMHSISNYYFDFNAKRYIEIDNSYENIINAVPINKKETEDIFTFMLCGMMYYPNDEEDTKKAVEKLHPRIEGKKICENLKKMRKQLAAANNLMCSTVECPSTGPCAGTCPQCDMEIAELNRMMMQIPAEKRVYPKFSVKRKNGVTSFEYLYDERKISKQKRGE